MRAVTVAKNRPRASNRKPQWDAIELAVSEEIAGLAGVQPSGATVDLLRSRLRLTVGFIWRWYDLDRANDANVSKKKNLVAAIAARGRALARLKKEAAGYLSATEEIERIVKDLVNITEASQRVFIQATGALLEPFVKGELVGQGPPWLRCFSNGPPTAHEAGGISSWADCRCGGPPQRERRIRSVVDAVSRLKPLEGFESKLSLSKRGRPAGVGGQHGGFHALVCCLLSAIEEARGSLTFSEEYGSGSLMEALRLLAPFLPPGVVPENVPRSRVRSAYEMWRVNRGQSARELYPEWLWGKN